MKRPEILAPAGNFEKMKAAIAATFYNKENGLFRASADNNIYTVLGCAFAMLIGLGDGRTLKAIKGECEEELVPATLSMLPYAYDVILAHDKEGGRDFVLKDIREKYSYMLSKDATSFWETIEGESAFHDAGSLCHGWSAIPVYYFKKLIR